MTTRAAIRTYSVETPVGVFSRNTKTTYTHIVVRKSDRIAKMAALPNAGKWAKDRGWAVTWHGSHDAALAAAAGKYTYDRDATLVGVFPVEGAK